MAALTAAAFWYAVSISKIKSGDGSGFPFIRSCFSAVYRAVAMKIGQAGRSRTPISSIM
jgi:hypothetical protein